MLNPSQLETAFQDFIQNFQKWVPDGVIDVNLPVLEELGLLNHNIVESTHSDHLMQQFHVVETPDKVTLFNEQFAIWIVPKMENDTPSTLTFIALLPNEQPHLEIVFSTSGVYNTPKYILNVLQHFLTEVADTESIISKMGKKIKKLNDGV